MIPTIGLSARLRLTYMSGLKIYLRSKVTQNYRWGQALAVSLLMIDGIIQLQMVNAPIYKPVVSFLMVALLVLSMTLGNRCRRRFRYLPGLMISLGGAVLMMNAWSDFMTTDWIWPVLLYGAGMSCIIAGLSQFLIDGPRWMTLSSRSVKLKHTMFPLRRHPWEQIKDLSVDERDVVIELRDGHTVRVQPERCDMQHLRSRVDGIYRSAHKDEVEGSKKADMLHDALEVGH